MFSLIVFLDQDLGKLHSEGYNIFCTLKYFVSNNIIIINAMIASLEVFLLSWHQAVIWKIENRSYIKWRTNFKL